jgi:hypothetical protein
VRTFRCRSLRHVKANGVHRVVERRRRVRRHRLSHDLDRPALQAVANNEFLRGEDGGAGAIARRAALEHLQRDAGTLQYRSSVGAGVQVCRSRRRCSGESGVSIQLSCPLTVSGFTMALEAMI